MNHKKVPTTYSEQLRLYQELALQLKQSLLLENPTDCRPFKKNIQLLLSTSFELINSPHNEDDLSDLIDHDRDSLFEKTPIALIVLNEQREILKANSMAKSKLYQSKAKLTDKIDKTDFTDFVKKDVSRFINWFSDSTSESLSIELHHPKQQGLVELTQTSYTQDNHKHTLISIIDMNKEHQLTQAMQLYKHVFENSAQGIMITDTTPKILYVNPAFTKITGYQLSDVQNKNPNILSSGEQHKHFYQDIYQQLNDSGYWKGVLYNRTKNGEIYPEELHISAVYSNELEEPKPIYYIGIFENTSQRLEREHQLKIQSEIDTLTGLYNRQGFNRIFETAFKEAQRQGEELALLFIDLDNFKYLNDFYGHDYGDELLWTAAKRLTSHIQNKGIVSRIGGDEFIILIQGGYLSKALPFLAANLSRALSQSYTIKDIEYRCTASIGVATYPEHAINKDNLIKVADAAMSQAKMAGKNKYRFFNKNLFEELTLQQQNLQDIKNAISKGEFKLHYQSQHDMKTGDLVGFEALVRWHYSDQEIKAPSAFLPQIENTPLIVELAKPLINQLFFEISSWQRSGFKWPVSLNLSANQLKNDQTYAQIATLCERYPSVVPLIHIEITEVTIFENDATIFTNLSKLKKRGLKLVLDDFGTGYSSIYSLKKFQFEVIKIDKSFVDDILLNNPENLVILNAMIRLIQELKIKIICEGVEVQQQVDYLLAKGCTTAQGYFYHRPMHKNNMLSYIEKYL